MRDCLVLGSGRSGTSMLGGILHEAGYFMGEDLYPSRESNPKGFFENPEINGINEEILKSCDSLPTSYVRGAVRRRVYGLLRLNRLRNPKQFQRWLCSIPPDVDITCEEPAILERIRGAVARRPFAYKDPRFSYTLPVWRPHLPSETVGICVFRAPDVTVASVLRECSVMPYLQDVRIDARIAYDVYVNNYDHAFRRAEEMGERLIFVHYDQIYDGTGLPRLSEALGVELGHSFVERALKRTRPTGDTPPRAAAVYARLCEAAEYQS